MNWVRRLAVGALIGGIVVVGLLAGCSKLNPGERPANMPPQTTLSYSPVGGDTASYRVRMNWFGWDEDGEIDHFRTKWDSEDWANVVNTDSLFLVSASANTLGFEYHTFRVAAVDNEGAVDASPETVAFTAYTVLPQTVIDRGPTGTTGPMVTFEWHGEDRDGVIVGYEYRLLKFDNGMWQQVVPPVAEGRWAPVGAEATSVLFGPLDGLHRFSVRAIDDAGAHDVTPAKRQFNSRFDLAGPTLYVRSAQFGTQKFRGPVWPSTFNLPTPIFAGERLSFTWVGSGEDYGGEVTGYRFAYDDTSTWPAWSTYSTHYAVTPTPGRHSLYVSARDNANVQTRARIFFEVVEASLDQYILIVDDWDFGEENPKWGTDEERDAFYDNLLVGYARDRFVWDPYQNLQAGTPQPPDVDALRGASTVIWYYDHEEVAGNTQTPEILQMFQASRYNALAGYVRVGGNVILTGWRGIQHILGSNNYPLEVTASDTTVPAAFVRDYLHIGYCQNSLTNSSLHSNPSTYSYVFAGAVPAPGYEDMFNPVYMDSVGPGGYPERGKWWIYTSPQYHRDGVCNVDKLESYQGQGLEIMDMDALINPAFEGQPCAMLSLSGDNHGNALYLGFPLYYCQYDQVKDFLDRILALFGEEKLVSEEAGAPASP
jgi:hypothetical protein